MSALVHGLLVLVANIAAIASIAMWVVTLRRCWARYSKKGSGPNRAKHPSGRYGDWGLTPFSVVLEFLLRRRRRERPFWTLADAMVMFGVHLVLLAVVPTILVHRDWIPAMEQPDLDSPSHETQLTSVITVIVAGLGSSLFVLAWLRLMDERPIRRLSLVFKLSDAKLGLTSAVMLLPPVLLISAMVNRLWPYKHQVLDLLQSVDSVAVFFAMFMATAIVTPFVEEFLFRVLIQGSIQGMIDRSTNDAGRWRPVSYLPILITSGLFAAMHLGQGAAPIPLFFLSLGLGYLYRQTGNITAPMVVHMVLNGFTLIAKFTEAAGPS